MLRIVLFLWRMDYGTMLNIVLFLLFTSGTVPARLPESLAKAPSRLLSETHNKSLIQIWIDDHIIVLVAVAVAAVLLILGTCWCYFRIDEESNSGSWVTYPDLSLATDNFSENLVGEGGDPSLPTKNLSDSNPTKNFSDSNPVGEGGKAPSPTRTDEESNPASWVTYTLTDLRNATNDFSRSNLIGKGSFGRVYRADFGGNTFGAVKRLWNVDSKRFSEEVSILLRLPRHANLVKILGICSDQDDQMIVFEYVANGTLSTRLHENQGAAGPLSWAARKEIARQVAEALRHLHEQAEPPIIHRDVKSNNVLLEHDFSVKLADFGMAKLGPKDYGSTSTTPCGTIGYVDPQCFREHKCSAKSDVYSFGVLLLEIITGSKAVIGSENLVIRTRRDRLNTDTMMNIVDQSLSNTNNTNELLEMIKIANRCVQETREERPTMRQVVNMMDEIRNA